MAKVMMMLGAFPFMLDTAAYQSLKRSSTYRWAQQDRIGRKPAQQYTGPGADQITLEGEIMPQWKGGFFQLDLMRAQARLGVPLLLLEGYGGVLLGDFVITQIDETKSDLMADGSPRVISFSLTLKEYGSDVTGLAKLTAGATAAAALVGLV